MQYFAFIIFFLLLGCASPIPKNKNFQECTVFFVSKLKYRPALGLLSKSCYLKYGKHKLGSEAKKIGSCITKKITNITSINDGKKLIDSCTMSNSQLKVFLNETLDDD